MGRYTLGTEPKPERRGVLPKRAVTGAAAAAGIAAVVYAGVHHHSDVISKTLTADCTRGSDKAVTDEISGGQTQLLTLESGITATVAAKLGRIALDPGDYEQYSVPGTIILQVDKGNLVSGKPDDVTGLYSDTRFVTFTCSLPPQ